MFYVNYSQNNTTCCNKQRLCGGVLHFEDYLLATCARSNKCVAIVTRNKEDFQDFGIDLYSPEELLAVMSQEKKHPAQGSKPF